MKCHVFNAPFIAKKIRGEGRLALNVQHVEWVSPLNSHVHAHQFPVFSVPFQDLKCLLDGLRGWINVVHESPTKATFSSKFDGNESQVPLLTWLWFLSLRHFGWFPLPTHFTLVHPVSPSASHWVVQLLQKESWLWLKSSFSDLSAVKRLSLSSSRALTLSRSSRYEGVRSSWTTLASKGGNVFVNSAIAVVLFSQLGQHCWEVIIGGWFASTLRSPVCGQPAGYLTNLSPVFSYCKLFIAHLHSNLPLPRLWISNDDYSH